MIVISQICLPQIEYLCENIINRKNTISHDTDMESQETNPLLQYDFGTPHDTIPFDKIKTEHFKPALERGMELEKEEIDAIIHNPEKPDFKNTIEALEHAGRMLQRTCTILGNLLSAESSDEMQETAMEMTPVLSAHSNSITLNEDLFRRVKNVYDIKAGLNLDKEQTMLLDTCYENFIRHGAGLDKEKKAEYEKLTVELSTLTLQYGQNTLKESHDYVMHITDRNELSGLPQTSLAAAEEEAKSRGLDGWCFTLDAPSYMPFMKYADNRQLRQKLYMAYSTLCTHGNDTDTTGLVRKIVNDRLAIARLLGYDTYAQYVLKRRMAEKPENVYNLLGQLISAYKPVALKEYDAVKAYAAKLEGKDVGIRAWDWAYYSDKLKQETFKYNEEELRPYFELERVKKGVFGLATKLYGITFKENDSIAVYHPDVKAYEVFDRDGSYLAVLYVDFHPRKGKHSGAWMTEYKGQWKENGTDSRPHISLVMNFTKPTQDKPALLTPSEVNTFLHEFGHALHGMMARTTYESLSGTNVYQDFVELPSQFMENFLTEEEFLDTFAGHYKTGEKPAKEEIKKIIDTANFNVAYACMRQVSFGLLDMAWHDRKAPFEGDIEAYEKDSWKDAAILEQEKGTCMSTNFGHLFSGGYAAGYYGYKWAEVLDADAFSVFKEKGIFNSETAESFRHNILEKGGTEPPMTLYKRFRGQEPTIDALLRRNGIIK